MSPAPHSAAMATHAAELTATRSSVERQGSNENHRSLLTAHPVVHAPQPQPRVPPRLHGCGGGLAGGGQEVAAAVVAGEAGGHKAAQRRQKGAALRRVQAHRQRVEELPQAAAGDRPARGGVRRRGEESRRHQRDPPKSGPFGASLPRESREKQRATFLSLPCCLGGSVGSKHSSEL
jgi:hypothetical protein